MLWLWPPVVLLHRMMGHCFQRYDSTFGGKLSEGTFETHSGDKTNATTVFRERKINDFVGLGLGLGSVSGWGVKSLYISMDIYMMFNGIFDHSISLKHIHLS